MAASGHRPTPAACFPPPPPPPLIPENGCFPYPPGSLVDAKSKFQWGHLAAGYNIPGPIWTHTSPALYSINTAGPTLTTSILTPWATPVTVQIVCVHPTFAFHKWTASASVQIT